MKDQRVSLELLAPARDLTCGQVAIDHGADAVYIGAPYFGARQAAGNSVEEIAQLCRYSHQYGARVYVTVNTIVYDDELQQVRDLLTELKKIGADAVLVQDMAVLQMCCEIGLTAHASTQTDNRSAEKVAWLYNAGFDRVVLARELSVKEMQEIHQQVPQVELEAFVHGALCVSISGICYASQHCFGRSANRGECAQFCRLPFTLVDKTGKTIVANKYLLSLKDMNRLQWLAEMADAGICSFKIEGRLKDETYVKNVVAAYRQALDGVIAKHPDRYCRASLGTVKHYFTPNLEKTFNRGYTPYGLHGREQNLWSPDTPKVVGEQVGRVKEIKGNTLVVAGTASFSNGDGLCFFDKDHQLQGFRVNRVEGNRLYLQQIPRNLQPNTVLYRNHDQAFQQQLTSKTAERTLPVGMKLQLEGDDLTLKMWLTEQPQVAITYTEHGVPHQPAQKPQAENIRKQLAKLGNTIFQAVEIDLEHPVEDTFIPSSLLSALRREAVEKLQAELENHFTPCHQPRKVVQPTAQPHIFYAHHQYQYNVSNRQARSFYVQQHINVSTNAFEIDGAGSESKLIMQCRHCIKNELGACSKNARNAQRFDEPLLLLLNDGTRYRLEFDCKQCQMNVYAE